jgi:hypothetical protein
MRFPIQRRWRQFHAGQMLQHGAGFAHRHFAGHQGCHLLHRRRGTACLLKAQRVVGGETPGLTSLTPATAAPDSYRPKTSLIRSLMPMGEPAQLMATHRADRWALAGFLLGSFCQQPPFQPLGLLEYLSFQIAHGLVGVQDRPVQTGR